MKLVNGVAVESLPLSDRAIQFGDGVFRTLKLVNGGVQFWDRQYSKLCSDCLALGITPPDAQVLLAEMKMLSVNSGFADAAIKIIISRGESARGYAIPPAVLPTRIVQISALPIYPERLYTSGVTVRLCSTRASWQPALAGIKHLNRLENVLARREWSDPAIFEGLMLDHAGHVLEGVMSNVFVLRHNELQTPALDEGGVAGVAREVVLEAAAQQLAWSVRIAPLRLPDLLASDAVWISNSLLGVAPVSGLAQTRWPVRKELIDVFARITEEEVCQL